MVERIQLTTERLLLRPYALDDVADVVAYAADEQWGIYLPIPRPYTVRDGEEFVARSILRSWDTGPMLAIVFNGKGIGSINVRVDVDRRIAEMGYAIAREHWGNGLTAEAARALLAWAFPTYGLDKVFARADARNAQSRRVMEKLGMFHEGTLRQHNVHQGERADEVWYGLLRSEWERIRAP